jgi:hypothetical protein
MRSGIDWRGKIGRNYAEVQTRELGLGPVYEYVRFGYGAIMVFRYQD